MASRSVGMVNRRIRRARASRERSTFWGLPISRRARGKATWILKRKTAASRFTRAVRTVAQWCRLHRHDPVGEQHKVLCQKLRGHYAYYGITGNSFAIAGFRYEVLRLWRKWLLRRRRAWPGTFDWFGRFLKRYPLPSAVAVHWSAVA